MLPRVLFFVEGFTDIRFVVGLSQICELTMAVPARAYTSSGLAQRLQESNASVRVHPIAGGRLGFQARSLAYLWRHAKQFDVIVAQEALRGALNANLVGWLRGVPVLDYLATAPLEYFRCRRERRQVGPVRAMLGEATIRGLLAINGRLADRWIALGPYLQDVAGRHCRQCEPGHYYGVDTDVYRPVTPAEKEALRQRLDLPPGRFLIFLSSRISHEKDPETVLQATALARSRGLNAVVLNLGGGYRDFLKLAADLGLPDAESWVLGRPAAHPMRELAAYYQAADVLAQASLAEGLGLSPLEALACGTPAVVTAVGGLAGHLDGYARLTPRCDPQRMAEQFLDVAGAPEQARAQALRGRLYVEEHWRKEVAFARLRELFERVVRERPTFRRGANR